jgi:hypothetical protein
MEAQLRQYIYGSSHRLYTRRNTSKHTWVLCRLCIGTYVLNRPDYILNICKHRPHCACHCVLNICKYGPPLILNTCKHRPHCLLHICKQTSQYHRLTSLGSMSAICYSLHLTLHYSVLFKWISPCIHVTHATCTYHATCIQII